MMGVMTLMEKDAQAPVEMKIRHTPFPTDMHPVSPKHTTQASMVSLSYFHPKCNIY
jgi:hypothetical protein